MSKINLDKTGQTFTQYFNKSVCIKLLKHGFDIVSPIYETTQSNNNVSELSALISKSEKLETLQVNMEFDEIILYSYNGVKFLFVYEYCGPYEAPDRMVMTDRPIIEFE